MPKLLRSAFAIALLLGSAAALALAVRNLLAVLPPGSGTFASLSAAYHSRGIVTTGLIAFALLILGVGVLRSAEQGRVSRLVIGALGLLAVLALGVRAGWVSL